MFMNAVLWGYIQFRLSEKNTLKVFIIFFEFRNCRTIQMNMLFAAICLLFKSKAGLGCKPKSLRLFAVWGILEVLFFKSLSFFCRYAALFAGLWVQYFGRFTNSACLKRNTPLSCFMIVSQVPNLLSKYKRMQTRRRFAYFLKVRRVWAASPRIISERCASRSAILLSTATKVCKNAAAESAIAWKSLPVCELVKRL